VLTAQLYSPSSLIMITRDANRLKIAANLGATHCITFGPTAAEEVMALTGGRGVDTVIESAGVPGTFELCQDIVAVGGTIANLGVHGCKVDLHLDKLWHKNIGRCLPYDLPGYFVLTHVLSSDYHKSCRHRLHGHAFEAYQFRQNQNRRARDPHIQLCGDAGRVLDVWGCG
jgi:threonine dehydrogenase-like Zn-dependent dehydrogenase